MGERENIIWELKSFKKIVSEKEDVERIILFGSWATGKPKKYSDIDLIVVSNAFGKLKCCRGARLYDYWKLPYPVDFICYTPREFAKLSKKVSIVSEALKRGVAI